MTVTLSFHARLQIANRAVVSEEEVLAAVSRHERTLSHAFAPEIRVVVKTMKVSTYLPDGSNGDVVVACVDTRSLKVKTVLLSRSAQVERRSREVPYLR